MRPEPDIIAITAQRDLASVRSAMAHGVLLYLLKPFTFAGFQEKIVPAPGRARRRRRCGESSATWTTGALAVLPHLDDRSTATGCGPGHRGRRRPRRPGFGRV